MAEDLLALLETDEKRDEEDVTTLGAFADAGIICDLTWNEQGLARLLPWMGPRTVAAAKTEIGLHSRTRQFRVEDLDWSTASTSFSPL